MILGPSGRNMNDEQLYLRPDVQVEPLIDQWYAWSQLISPATLSRNMTHRHFKIMDSYISAPAIHANAIKNPKMLGGPFIDYQGGRVNEIRKLKEGTLTRRANLVAFSQAIDELDAYLRKNAIGYCLQPLYSCIPEILRGYVELGYDLNNNPAFRFVEPLLYRSKYYDETAQSVMISITTGDERAFVLSTPRLDREDAFHIQIPLKSEALDDLFRLKQESQCWSCIRTLLPSTSAEQTTLLRTFFTPHNPHPYTPYHVDGVRWRYFGHACILIETLGLRILFDPVISYDYSTSIPRYTYSDLPDTIDYVIITHNHQDHILLETMLQIRHKVKAILVPRASGGKLYDLSIKLALEMIGFRNVYELQDFETVETNRGSITALPFFGEHADLDIQSKKAYVVKIGPHSLMFAADSCNIEPKLYEHVHSAIGEVDALFLGMECDGAPLTWLYGPLMTQNVVRAMDESRRLAGCNYEQAAALVNQFGCKEVYVYAMGQEPWLNHVMSIKYTEQSRPIVDSNRLIDYCTSRGIVAERLYGEKEMILG
jgi:L-ascorbate metabolism protein UlaG (beta-lactamase superfamily)